jgi:D-arabinose 1-dehydrogenase-like Zn-dependent alcohol dehydrogenase
VYRSEKKLSRVYLAREIRRSGVDMTVPRTMKAIRLHAPGVDGLRYETIETPPLRAGEVLVEVHAAAITRDELEWPLDRLPAIPSYELSGVVVAADDDAEVSIGDEVYALTPFDRDGVAAEYAAVTATLLAPKPASLSHVESAAVPLPALTAWQGLFVHGRLAAGERVLVHGAVGGVGQFATQLGRWRGSHVIATASPDAFQQHVRLERTRLSMAGADSSTMSSTGSISSSTRSAASSSCAPLRYSRGAVASSRSPRSRRGKGRTS